MTRANDSLAEGRASAAGCPDGAPDVLHVLASGARLHGDLEVHHVGPDTQTTVTLTQVWDESTRLAADLAALGARPGDVIAFQIRTWREGAIAFYAALALRAVPLPLVHHYADAEIEWILRDAGASFLLVAAGPDRAAAEGRAAAARRVPTVRAVVAIERAGSGVRWDVVDEARGQAEPAAPGSPDEGRTLLLYTSGTESNPKGVWHTHASVLAEVTGPRPCGHSVAPDEVVLFTGPLGHVGSAMYLVYPFAHGLPVVYMDRWDAGVAAEAIERRQVTFTHGPPTVVMRLADEAERNPGALRSLRRIRIGGAEIDPGLITRLDQELGVLTFRTYGSTEHPTTTSGTEDDGPEKRATTDGRPLPGNEARIVDPAGRDLPSGEEGEIWTRGGERFAGYRNASLDAAALVDGWYRTGDLGLLDGEGYLVVTGRIKDVIVRGGENIPAGRVIETLVRHEAVTEAAVVAAKDPLFGERVFAFVVTDPGRTVTIDDLRAHFAAQGVARQYVPEGLECVTTLPRNAMGKVRRDVLRTRADELAALDPPNQTRK